VVGVDFAAVMQEQDVCRREVFYEAANDAIRIILDRVEPSSCP